MKSRIAPFPIPLAERTSSVDAPLKEGVVVDEKRKLKKGSLRRFAQSALIPPNDVLFTCEGRSFGWCDHESGKFSLHLFDSNKLPFDSNAISRVVPTRGGGLLVGIAGKTGGVCVLELRMVKEPSPAKYAVTCIYQQTEEEAKKCATEKDGRIVTIFAVADPESVGFLFVTCSWRGTMKFWKISADKHLMLCGSCELPFDGKREHRVATCCSNSLFLGRVMVIGDECGALHYIHVGVKDITLLKSWEGCHANSRVAAIDIVQGIDGTKNYVELLSCGYDRTLCRWTASVGPASSSLVCTERRMCWQGMHHLEGFTHCCNSTYVWGIEDGEIVIQNIEVIGDVRLFKTLAKKHDFEVYFDESIEDKGKIIPSVLLHRKESLAVENNSDLCCCYRSILIPHTHGAEVNRIKRLPFQLRTLLPLTVTPSLYPSEQDDETAWYVTASRDKSLRLWRLDSDGFLSPIQHCRGVVYGHSSSVKDLAFCRTADGHSLMVSGAGNFELFCHSVLLDVDRSCPCIAPLCSGTRVLQAAQSAHKRALKRVDTGGSEEDDNDDDFDEDRCRFEAITAFGGPGSEAWVTCGASDGLLYSLVIDATAGSVRSASETPVVSIGAVPLCMCSMCSGGVASTESSQFLAGLSTGDIMSFSRTRERCTALRVIRGVLAAGVNSIAMIPEGKCYLCVGDDGAVAECSVGEEETESKVIDRTAGLGSSLEGVSVIERSGGENKKEAVCAGLSQHVRYIEQKDEGDWHVLADEVGTEVADAKDVIALKNRSTMKNTIIVVGQGVELLTL